MRWRLFKSRLLNSWQTPRRISGVITFEVEKVWPKYVRRRVMPDLYVLLNNLVVLPIECRVMEDIRELVFPEKSPLAAKTF